MDAYTAAGACVHVPRCVCVVSVHVCVRPVCAVCTDCEASSSGSLCRLAHLTLTPPTRCSQTSPGPREPSAAPTAPSAPVPTCPAASSAPHSLLCQEPPPHTQARPESPDSAVTLSLCGSCPHSRALELARPSPASPPRPRGPSCPLHPQASCHPTPGVLNTSCWLGLGAGREMGRGEGHRCWTGPRLPPAPARPG